MDDHTTCQLYTNPSGLLHDTGSGHPENAQRLKALSNLFKHDYSHLKLTSKSKSKELEWLKTIHDPELIHQLSTSTPGHIDGDTVLSEHSWQAAVDAVSISCQAVDDVMNSVTQSAFCALRPPGHHAEYDQAMGFCLLNNVYCAAQHAVEQHDAKTIVIIDWDVHHGNGTDNLVRTHNPDGIYFFSTHQWPLFPGTGRPDEPAHPHIVNRPLAAGTSSTEFRSIYESEIFPRVKELNPDLILVSAGFDAHRDDPLASLNLDEEDFAFLTNGLKSIQSKMVLLLEGGYDLPSLENSVSSVLDALIA